MIHIHVFVRIHDYAVTYADQLQDSAVHMCAQSFVSTEF